MRPKKRRAAPAKPQARQDNRVPFHTMEPQSVPADTRVLMIPNLTDDEHAFLKIVVAKALEGYRAIH